MQRIEFKFLNPNEWRIVKVIRLEKQIEQRLVWADLVYSRVVSKDYVTKYDKKSTQDGILYSVKPIYPNDKFDELVLKAVQTKYPNAHSEVIELNTDTCIERISNQFGKQYKEEAIIYLNPDLSEIDPMSVAENVRFSQYRIKLDVFVPCKEFLMYFGNEGYFDYYNLSDKDAIEGILKTSQPTVRHLNEFKKYCRKIGIIIQARLGSTRLPGKILKDFYGDQTLLETVINNLKKIGFPIVVATSVNPNNDKLEAFLKERGIAVYRGSEDDVLSRFIGAADANGIDGIVRICSDNPFLDWHGVADLIENAKMSDADYIGYRINNTPSIKTHFGFWGEYVTLDALKRVAATTDEKPAHEHVTIHIYTHPDEYRCEWIECPDFLQGRNDIRLTVDNPEDFENAQRAYAELMSQNPNFDLGDVVAYIDSHKDLQESMKQMIENNQK